MKKMKKWSIAGFVSVFLFCAVICFLPERVNADITFTPLSMNNVWVNGEIGVADEVDYYTVTIPNAGWLTVSLQGYSVYDSYIEVWTSDLAYKYERKNAYYSDDATPKTVDIALALEPGTYRVKVYASGNHTGTYKIRASYESAGSNVSGAKDFDTAHKLNMNSSVTGFLSEDDKVDIYQITLSSATTVRFLYTSYINSSEFSIWDKDRIKVKDGRETVYASRDESKTLSKEVPLQAGIYYVKVTSSNYHGRYTLKCESKIFVSNIKISGKKEAVAGSKFTLTASVSPKDAADKNLKWSSNNTSVASVDGKGKVTTYRPGKVKITATAQDGSNVKKTWTVIVTPKKMNKPYARNYAKRRAYVSWSKAYGASGYQIQYSTRKNFKSKKTKKVSSRYSYTYLTRLSKKTYYIRVRSYLKIGKKTYYGKWSSARKVKIKR